MLSQVMRFSREPLMWSLDARSRAACLLHSGDAGLCGVTFSAPLVLKAGASVECNIDLHGGVTIGSTLLTDTGRSSFGMRSSGKVRMVVGSGPTPGSRRASSCGEIQTHARLRPRAVLSRVTTRADIVTSYHIAPAVLDSVFHSGTALAGPPAQGGETRERLQRSENAEDDADGRVNFEPQVPAAVRGVLMQDKQARCTVTWGSSSVESKTSGGRSSATSNHRGVAIRRAVDAMRGSSTGSGCKSAAPGYWITHIPCFWTGC